MGQTLSEPAVEKHTTSDEDELLAYACSDMQGWRLSMEDAHTSILDLEKQLNKDAGGAHDATAKQVGSPSSVAGPATGVGSSGVHASFFAVYDGHGGSAVAEYSGQRLYRTLMDTAEYQRGAYADALRTAFLVTDDQLRASPQYAADPSGCTAVAALLVGNPGSTSPPAREQASDFAHGESPGKALGASHVDQARQGNAGPSGTSGSSGEAGSGGWRLFVANAGDSRCVLSVAGEAKAMSYDHKPTSAGETARIVAAGGFVEMGRVNGNLALSRALGDFEFKANADLAPARQIVSPEPDVLEWTMGGEEEFIVLACDGIWDCLSSQQVVDIVRRGIADGTALPTLCEHVLDTCLAPPPDVGGIGCDNMTLQIVLLRGHRSASQYTTWIRSRVANGTGYPTPRDTPPIFRSQGGSGRGPNGMPGLYDDDDGDLDDDSEEEYALDGTRDHEMSQDPAPGRPGLGGPGGPSPRSVFSALAGTMNRGAHAHDVHELAGPQDEPDEGSHPHDETPSPKWPSVRSFLGVGTADEAHEVHSDGSNTGTHIMHLDDAPRGGRARARVRAHEDVSARAGAGAPASPGPVRSGTGTTAGAPAATAVGSEKRRASGSVASSSGSRGDGMEEAEAATPTPTGGETPQLVTSPTAFEIPDKDAR